MQDPVQRRKGRRVLFPDIRLLADHAQAAARHIRQYQVKRLQQFLIGTPGVHGPGVDCDKAQALCAFFQAG